MKQIGKNTLNAEKSMMLNIQKNREQNAVTGLENFSLKGKRKMLIKL